MFLKGELVCLAGLGVDKRFLANRGVPGARTAVQA
jgi:hypothetical protein